MIKKNVEVEFSQAISYVNKIKTRFADQPDIYKQFSGNTTNLSARAKANKRSLRTSDASFQKAPDLLEDFKKFLPGLFSFCQSAGATCSATCSTTT